MLQVLTLQAQSFAGGDGSSGDPYQVNNLAQLNAVRNNLSLHFILLRDLDFVSVNDSEASNDNMDMSGGYTHADVSKGWLPIGHDTDGTMDDFQGTPFTGSFNGKNFSISNLFIGRGGEDHVGMFGTIGASGTIDSLGLIDIDSISNEGEGNDELIGGLAARNEGTITHCYATGVIEGDSTAGGLVGLNAAGGTISHCYAAVAVGTPSDVGATAYVGGLVGDNRGSISHCYTTGDIRAAAFVGILHIGGIAGNNSNSITHCYTTGAMRGSVFLGHIAIGGIVGENSGSIANCYATGSASRSGSGFVGGLVGAALDGTVIENSYAIGFSNNNSNVGGLVGSAEATTTITNTYWDVESTPASSLSVNGGNNINSTGNPGRTSAQLQVNAPVPSGDNAVYVGWDASIWCFRAGVYPGLVGVSNYCTSLAIAPLTVTFVENTAANQTIGTIIAVSGTPPYTYEISNVAPTSADIDAFDIDNNGHITTTAAFIDISVMYPAPVVATATVTVTDNVNAQATATLRVAVLPKLALADRTVILHNDTEAGQVVNTADVTGGFKPYTYEISNVDPDNANIDAFDIDNNGAITATAAFATLSLGSYDVTITVTDSDDTIVTVNLTVKIIASPFVGGQGTRESPFQITTLAELNAIRDNREDDGRNYLNSYFILMNNLDFASVNDVDGTIPDNMSITGGYTYAEPNKGWLPIGILTSRFRGSFNGQGYTISNLYINRPSEEDVALFGYTNARIDSLGLLNVNVTGNSYTSSLTANNGGTINSCYATGEISGENDVGGLIGVNSAGRTMNSYATVNVIGNHNVGGLVGRNFNSNIADCYATGNVSGNRNVGGLTGHIFSGDVSNCYATGTVTGTDRNIGGLTGNASSTDINNCYAIGTVNGTTNNTGGLIGNNSNVTVVNSYWNTESSGQGNASVPADRALGARTTAQLQIDTPSTDTYVDWSTGDNAGTWCFRAGFYPGLVEVGNGCTAPAVVPVALSPLSVTVQEDATTGTSIATATATGGTPSYTYTIGNADPESADIDAFDIDNNGRITTTAAFMDLSTGIHTATVTATDNVNAQATATLTATVTAAPAPLALSPLSATVQEDATPGTGVTTATATGGTLSYTYTIGNVDQPDITAFAINLNNGAITTANAFADLATGMYTAIITVTDANNNMSTAMLTATVTAAPVPLALSPLSATVQEDATPGTGVATATATGGTPSYTYEISNADPESADIDAFDIDNNGRITTTAAFMDLSTGIHTATVTATDNVNAQATATLTATVTAAPAPLALSPLSATVQEDATPGTGVTTATATGGTLPYTYEISNADPESADINAFDIDNNGRITTTAAFVDLSTGIHTAIITVTDANNNMNTATLTATVTAAPPMLAAFTAPTDLVAGTAGMFTLMGSRLSGVTVTITGPSGGIAPTSTVNSDGTTITVTVPAAAIAGTYTIMVRDGSVAVYTVGTSVDPIFVVAPASDVVIFGVPAATQSRIYPNPTSGRLRFIHLPLARSYTYRVYSLTGTQVQAGKLHIDNSIDVSSLTPARYVLLLYDQDSSFTFRVNLLVK